MIQSKKGWAAIAVSGCVLTGGVYQGLTGLEGTRYVAYIPILGDVPTICQGETKGVKMGNTATKAQCDAMLLKRVEEFGRGVDACIKPKLPDKVKAAYVSMAYNIGLGSFCGSSVAKLTNAGQPLAACDAMMHWTRAGNNPYILAPRRRQETRLCTEGALE